MGLTLWIDDTKVADLASTLNPSLGYIVNAGLDSMVRYGTVEIRWGIKPLQKPTTIQITHSSLLPLMLANSLPLAPEFQGCIYSPWFYNRCIS